MNIKRFLVSAALASAAVAAASMADATVIHFTFTGTNLPLLVTGEMTTTGVSNGVFGQDVTSMSGTVDGAAFTFVPDPDAPYAVNTPDGAFNYDDNFSIAQHSPDAAGLLFDVGNTEYNLYKFDGVYSVLSYTAGNTVYNPQVNGTLAVTVPEPATWALLMLGMGGLGLALRTRRRAGATVLA